MYELACTHTSFLYEDIHEELQVYRAVMLFKYYQELSYKPQIC